MKKNYHLAHLTAPPGDILLALKAFDSTPSTTPRTPAPGVGGFKRPAATCADPERALAPQLPRRDEARRSPNRERVHRARTSLRRPCVIGLFQFVALVRIS